MCDGCFALIGAVIEANPTRLKGRRRDGTHAAEPYACNGRHTPDCTYRRLRPAEAIEWLRENFPNTMILLDISLDRW